MPVRASAGARVHQHINRGIMGTASAVAMLIAAPHGVHAQTPAQTAQPANVDEIVVTGTRIIRDGYEAPTPLSVLGPVEIESAAPANIADFVNQLPSLAGSSTPRSTTAGVSAGQTGINALALRGLGANRTLILLDGQRVAASTLTGLVDINGFPQALVSRVDVVTGGASAAWGSDAISGVINFVLDKKYTGLKGELQGGVTTYGDDRSYKMSLTGGTGFASERGHIIVSAENSYVDGIRGLPRPWYTGVKTLINPAYGTGPGQSTSVPQLLIRQGTGFSNATPGFIVSAGPLKGVYFGPGGVPAQFNYGSLVNDPFVVGGDWRYADFGQTGDLDMRISHRSIFTRTSYAITDDIEVFLQASYGIARTSERATNQFNLGNLTIQRDNAFLPAQIVAQMTAAGVTNLRGGSLNADLGSIPASSRRALYRYVVGASGKFDAFDSAWTWDIYGQKSRSDVHNDTLISNTPNYNRAIDAVRAPNGSIVCRSTLTNPTDGCVPYNILGVDVNSQAARNYVLGTAFLKVHLGEEVVAGSVHGTPFSTWAGPVSVAGGVEYRREKVGGSNDGPSNTNSWFAGNYHASFGSYHVTEGFAEAVVPLAKDAVWAKAFDLNAAIRGTDYSTSGFVTTWKVGATYSLIDDITIRATRSRDIRAPNLAENFQAGQAGTGTIADPFRNNAQSTYITLTSGNPNLVPEKADSTGIGVVLQPRFFPGFSASVDYYNIDIAQAIFSVSGATIVNNCYAGNTVLCGQIIRDASGAISRILVQPVNLLSQTARGVDFEASYRTRLDAISNDWSGEVALRFLATHYLKNYSSNGVNVPTDSAGQNTVGGPPSWRYLATASYSDGPVRVSLTARAISAGVYNTSYVQCSSGCPVSNTDHFTIDNNQVAGAFYMDAAFNYKVTDTVETFLTIENLMNKNPPPVPPGTGIGAAPIGVNTTLYDVLGRTFRGGVRFKM
ncbi:MAG: TonB-dependent receptor [Rhodospirillaceae bacterium]|nr:TonB-dependent receptor [Rhodospirillaceae bacterium]